MPIQLLLALAFSVALLLTLVLALRLNAFLALLLASIGFGLTAGMEPILIIDNISKGMGSTLAVVATIVGLGAILGAVLEHSGGSQALAHFLLDKLGEKRAPLAFVLTGFFVAIPVFFDVAFVLLVPLVYALGRKTGRSILHFGIPLLAGLAATHAFIPPTPGPIAVSEILGADLGRVIGFGFIVGIPTVLVAGLWWGRRVGDKYFVAAPPLVTPSSSPMALPDIRLIFALILLPIVLILGHTLSIMQVEAQAWPKAWWTDALTFVGHPYVALLIACCLALYTLGTRRGLSSSTLQQIASKALAPAGTIILITGAGGVYKQMLVESGTGKLLAEALLNNETPSWWFSLLFASLPFLAFVLSALVRVLQGSATVAMITAAGFLAPILSHLALVPSETALIVLAVAAGASTFSHVNDSGFWLVKEYLLLDEATTFRTWTLMTGLLSLVAISIIMVLFLVVKGG